MIASLIGWVGTLLYLVNHGLLALSRIARGRGYYTVNAIAAALVAASSVVLPSWQAVAVNSFWVLVSVAGYLGVSLRVSRGASIRGLLALCLALLVVAAVSLFSNPVLSARWLGWSATVLFCGSYLLYAVGRLLPRTFFACNAAAAFGLVPVLVLDQNWPVVVLEAVWGVLSLVGWYSSPAADEP